MSKKHVRILKLAKRKISNGIDAHVCLAIKSASNDIYNVFYELGGSENYKRIDKETYELLLLIENSMFPYGTVDSWLSKTKEILLTTKQSRKYRIAWIDNMIEYWKDK